MTYWLTFSTHSPVPVLHAAVEDMLQITYKANVLYYREACFKVFTTANEPVANIIDGNVQLYALSYIPDNFQGVAEMVLDHLPKSARVDFVIEIPKEN